MALVPIFRGHVTSEGRLELDEREASYRRAHLQSLVGRDVEVIVRKKREQRSLDQNAYLHAVPFPLLQEELGYESIEELKYALMGACWGWKPDRMTGREVPVKPSTSSMTVEECSQFIDWLIKWAGTPGNLSTHGIHIPLPNEAAA